MLHNIVRLTALAGCAVGALIVAGCGAREPIEAPPSARASGHGETQTPELMGAPPAETAPADGLLGGPSDVAPVAGPVPVTRGSGLRTWRRPDGTLVTAMAPIANPKTQPHRAVRYAPRAVAAPVRRGHVATPAPKPVAQPATKLAVTPAPKPVAVAPALAPVKPLVAAKPAAPLAKAPMVAAAPAAKPLTKLQRLQAAVAPEATRGAVLASGESLRQGQEGQVTLSLPATLGDMIKTQAAKLGLGKAAKKTSAYADLRGEGYEITPNGRQTAAVKAGEAATFAWRVKPTPAAKGQLKTEFGVELGGTKPVQDFTLGSIAKQVVPIQEAVSAKAKGFNLSMPSLGRYETIDVPGLGKTPGKSVLGGALVLLALLILVAISRNASAARSRAERRRKFRTQNDYGRNEMEFETPQTASVNYVNPMVAAAGGALAGAAVASAVSHDRHDDPGHGQQEHALFDAPRADQGHGPAHDAPVVAAEAHAEALPVGDHHQAEDQGHGVEHGGHGPDTPAVQPAPDSHVQAEHKELQPAH